MGILSVNLNNIYLDNNFDEAGPGTIIFIRILARHCKFKKRKAFKKKTSEQLMPTAWHPKRWQNFCCQKIKRRNKTVF